MATRLGKRPHPKNYATYDPKGKAQYRKDLAEYLKKKAAMEKEKNKLSTKKNIEKQKTSNKKASTAKPKTTAKPKVTPKATATTKAKSLATGKRTSTPKAVETVKTPKATTTRRKVASSTKKKVTAKPKVTPKKPAGKIPAGKVPAKKPLISNKNKLRIKKAAAKTVDTGKKIAASTKKKITKAATEGKKLINKPSPTKRPVTKGQKLASRGNQILKKTGKYIKKQVLPKAKKDLVKVGKGILKDPKSLVKGVKGAGIAYVAEKGLNQLIDRGFKQIRPETRGKNMTLKEYRARVAKANKEARKKYGIIPTAKKIVNKVRGKSGESSTTKNIKKQKTNNKNLLKSKKSESSSKVNRNKDYNAKTGVKKYNPNMPTFREDAKANTKLQLEIQNQGRKKNKVETYSRVLSKEAKKQKSNASNNNKLKVAKPGSARAKMIAKNEARFGKAKVDKLRQKNADFQAMKKKKMTKAEFIRKYPNSQTAKRAKGLIR